MTAAIEMTNRIMEHARPRPVLAPAHLSALDVPLPIRREISDARIEAIGAELLKLPQTEMPLEHKFAPGVYLRKILMPAGTFVIGHRHKTEHFNIVLAGRATVLIDGEVHQIQAPCILTSHAGARKVLYIHETMEWATVHANPTLETDVDALEEILVVKSPSLLELEDMKKLNQIIAPGDDQNDRRS